MSASKLPVAARSKLQVAALVIGALFQWPILVAAVADDGVGPRNPATAELPAHSVNRYQVKRLTVEQTARLQEADRMSAEAMQLDQTGKVNEAAPLFEKALKIRRQVLGDDHPDLKVRTREDMARLQEAEKLYNDAVMRLGLAGRYGEAIRQVDKALEIRSDILGGDDLISTSMLSILSFWHLVQRDFQGAEVVMWRAADYWKGRCGDSHPMYAYWLNKVGAVYVAAGDYTKAERVLLQTAEIERNAYGAEDPQCADTLSHLATMYFVKDVSDKAALYSSRAAELEEKSALAVLAGASEAEALDIASKGLMMPEIFLSASRRTKTPAGDAYRLVWATRGMVLQAIARRQESLRSLVSPALREEYELYLRGRRELARFLLAPAEADPVRLTVRKDSLIALSNEKERLERDLARQIPEFSRQLQAQCRPYTELAARLPQDAVFIDFTHYFDKKRDVQYVAFVLAPGRPVIRVELGRAAAINAAVADWREAINAAHPTSAAEPLRRLLWEPVENGLPRESRTVYLCADGALTTVPWAALPGKEPGSVLLEQYAVAVVPSGQFLLEELLDAKTTSVRQGTVLAVGEVAYDARPQEAIQDPRVLAMTSRAATPQGRQLHWQPLIGTADELAGLRRAASTLKVVKLTGADASTGRVLAELPHARWAHLATHGFFADRNFRSILHADESLFDRGNGSFRVAPPWVGRRNPLVLSGLVLAGANLPRQKDALGVPSGDGGILTAEAIAGLDLSQLDLAVLSACETGLGDVAGGEGVFGLQRAFHLAGARSVIASLWKVDDKATAVLMQLFYRNLWQKNLPPIEALRQAQLALYHHPELIDLAGAARSLDLSNPGPLPRGGRTAPTGQWAAFVLSGAGY
jgi:CHAT domain-containing protein